MTYVYLALAFVVACFLAYLQGRSDGGELVKSEYSTRDLADAREQQVTFAAWNARNRATEAASAKRATKISTTLEEDIANGKVREENLLAAVRDGGFKLRLTDPTGVEGCGSAPSTAGRTPSERDGGTQSRFLGSVDTAFLVAEASRADLYVKQLAACQAVIRSDRE